MVYRQEDFQSQDQRFRANLINSVSGFKSVALVGTKSSEGTSGLSVISQILHVGAHPPLLGMLFRPHTVPRHTLENILATKSFTVNHITQDFYIDAHHTAARWEGSEFEKCNLREEYHEGVRAPFVGQSIIKSAYEFKEMLDVTSNGTHFVVGEMTKLIIPDEMIASDGFVDLEKAGSLITAGLDAYYSTQRFSRLTYPKPDLRPTELDS